MMSDVMQPVRVLAITRKPHSASFEQRITNFVEPLKAFGVEVDVAVYPKKLLRQVAVLSRARQYDVVWWHRHLLPWWQLRLLRGKARYLVYDFDDPVCFSTREDGASSVRSQRFRRLVGAADAVLAGSHYLRDLAEAHNGNVHIVPMAIDLPPEYGSDLGKTPRELLWLGSESTQKYLELIRPALEDLGRQRRDLKLRLVAHKPMTFGDLDTEFVQWSPQTQDEALRECTVGLCPMPDNPWTRGKCPYKVLQYMSHAMPWVGSAVGENIVTAGEPEGDSARGRVAMAQDEWVAAIVALVDVIDDSRQMGMRARRYIEVNHERHHIAERVAAILREGLSDALVGHV